MGVDWANFFRKWGTRVMEENTRGGELDSFRRFLAAQLDQGRDDQSPEECLRAWRLEHPLPDELRESVAAVERALEQARAGLGKSLDEFDRDFRARHGMQEHR